MLVSRIYEITMRFLNTWYCYQSLTNHTWPIYRLDIKFLYIVCNHSYVNMNLYMHMYMYILLCRIRIKMKQMFEIIYKFYLICIYTRIYYIVRSTTLWYIFIYDIFEITYTLFIYNIYTRIYTLSLKIIYMPSEIIVIIYCIKTLTQIIISCI